MSKVKIQGVYLIRNIYNNKVYVGSSVDVYRRFKEHKCALKGNYHYNLYLQAAWNKGVETSFVFSVLRVVINTNLLLRFEQVYINRYNAGDRECGYNGRKIAASNGGHKGRMSLTKRKALFNSKIKKILQYDLDGVFIKEWDYVKEVTRVLHFRGANIAACCRGFTDFANGFQWRYYTPNYSLFIGQPKCKGRSRLIGQYDLAGSFIKEWTSAALVEKILGISRKSVTTNCLGKSKTGCGYVWKYH